MKTIYIVHGPEGFLEVRKKLENAKRVVRNYLRQYGFTHELKSNLQDLTTGSDDYGGEGGQWEVDVGGDEPGNLYLSVAKV